MKHLTQYILFESGSIGGNRILRDDVKPTVEKYEKEVLQKFPGYKKYEITGSYNAGTKKDHGDIDLCIWIDSKEDIKNVKKEFKKHVEDLPDELTPKFRSGRNQGKKAQLYGSIVTCQIPIVGKEDEFVQIDNIIVLTPEELNFQKSFLNLNAQLQTFDTAIVRVAPDDKKEKAFKHYGIADLPRLDTNQEFEFVLSSAGLSLRKVTLTDERKQKAKEEIWRSVNWEDVTWLLDMILDFKSDGKEYEEMLDRAAEVFKNDERARKRMCGVMKSMINIGPGEVGTPKGEAKEKGIKLAYNKLGVKMNENKIENNIMMKSLNNYITEKLSFSDAFYKFSCKIMGVECITQDKYIKELKSFVQEHSNNKCSIIIKTYKQIKSDLNNCLNKNEYVDIPISNGPNMTIKEAINKGKWFNDITLNDNTPFVCYYSKDNKDKYVLEPDSLFFIAAKTKKGYREIKCGLWLNADDPAAFGWQVKNVKIPQALDYDQWKANEKKKADEKKKQEQESIKATIKRMENELAQLKKIIKTEE